METQTVTIQVAPQTADILKAKAAAQGMSIDDLLLQLAEGAPEALPQEKKAKRKSLLGAFQHLKLEVTPEDIQEVRREMWRNFPRELPE